MSRAFTREPDGDHVHEDLPERPVSPHHNWVTPAGLRQIEEHIQTLEQQRDQARAANDAGALAATERDLRYWQERLDKAIQIDPATQAHDKVGFSATVETVDDKDVKRSFTLVGEDEAEPKAGKISWVSPLARALSGASVGDTVLWKRPAGDLSLEILSIKYPKA